MANRLVDVADRDFPCQNCLWNDTFDVLSRDLVSPVALLPRKQRWRRQEHQAWWNWWPLESFLVLTSGSVTPWNSSPHSGRSFQSSHFLQLLWSKWDMEGKTGSLPKQAKGFLENSPVPTDSSLLERSPILPQNSQAWPVRYQAQEFSQNKPRAWKFGKQHFCFSLQHRWLQYHCKSPTQKQSI